MSKLSQWVSVHRFFVFHIVSCGIFSFGIANRVLDTTWLTQGIACALWLALVVVYPVVMSLFNDLFIQLTKSKD